MLGNRSVELFVDIAVTTVAAAMVGLALSALARSNEQIMPLLVVAIMSQLVFSGGMIPVTDRIVLDQMSWFTPGPVGGFRGVGVDDRPHPAGPPRPADPPQRPALATYVRSVAVRHGNARRDLYRLHRFRALADPAVEQLTYRP